MYGDAMYISGMMSLIGASGVNSPQKFCDHPNPSITWVCTIPSGGCNISDSDTS